MGHGRSPASSRALSGPWHRMGESGPAPERLARLPEDARRRFERRRHKPSAPLRALVAHPSSFACELLGAQLVGDARFDFAGAAAHETALLILVDRAQPDVAIVHANLPPHGAIPAVRAALARRPQVQVVVLADVDDDPDAPEPALAALRAGAKGYLDHELPAAAVAEALAAVAHGELALSRRLTMLLLTRLISTPEHATGMRPIRSTLSDREWQVLDLLDAGLSTSQIADQFVVSTETVRSHIKRILRKLDVHSRADAIAAARKLRRQG